MTVLITGAAGFIGFHLSQILLQQGKSVVGVDSLNDYYNPALKQSRLDRLKAFPHFVFYHFNLCDDKAVDLCFKNHTIEQVVHLAAQPGVRYSFTHPRAYIENNLDGFFNILDASRRYEIEHFVFASSSSVYGANEIMPLSENHCTDHPLNLYAATKKSNEMMAHAYSEIYRLPCTGLRFFTVYGPWGRPDMAPYLFTKSIVEGETIRLFNHGNMKRDFTYIDDIIGGIVRIMDVPASPEPAWSGKMPETSKSKAPYRLYNIGNHEPVPLLTFVQNLEDIIGVKANIQMEEMQPGEVLETYADVSALEHVCQFKPYTPLRQGLEKFVEWYVQYYAVAI